MLVRQRPPAEARAETIATQGCEVVLRRVEGPEARELFIACHPLAAADRARGGRSGAAQQAEAIYRGLVEVLEAQGGSFQSVVCETIFLRDAREDLEPIRSARHRVLAARDDVPPRPATSEIEQPPLDECASLEVAVQAILPNVSPFRVDSVAGRPTCDCLECARAHGLRFNLGTEARFHAGGLCGPGENAYEQALGMFDHAESMLEKVGMDFRDVVRTWIHLREMDRDYDALNRARRRFFEVRGVAPVPASTGIGGGPMSRSHDLCLGVYAVKSGRPGAPATRTVMTTPTLNEAKTYGADFVRGMKTIESNKVALHVSGTASIDEAGRTAHPGDFDAQADRMLLNIAALLDGQGAGFADVVSAITYLRRPADAARLHEKLHHAGFEGFPNIRLAAPICRPDLLCEIEALAVLPRAAHGNAEPRSKD